MNDKCHGLLGRLFGHKFQPRYDEKTTGAAAAAPQADHMWAQITVTPAVAFASDLSADLRRTIEALGTTESIHTHDVCARCGAIVPAPTKRSVTAPTASAHAAAPAASTAPTPAPKVVVVPVSAGAVAAVAAQASVNPARAIPGHGPK